MRALSDLALTLASQIDPNLGTKEAQAGAVQRMAEPHTYDLVFPVLAFLIVIVIPVAAALWVIYKAITDKTKEADET